MLYSFLCRLSCDKEVVRRMRGHTLGNRANALYRQLCVRHGEQWVSQSAEYLSVLGKFMAHATDPGRLAAQIPQMVTEPCPGWLLSLYAKDVLTRLLELKARVTYIYGSILKMDSTKKARQLEQQHGSQMWAMSLGRSSCVSLRHQRVMTCFPCALE